MRPGATETLSVHKQTSTEEVKDAVEALTGVPMEQQRVIFGCKQLENGQVLADFSVEQDSTLHMVLRCGLLPVLSSELARSETVLRGSSCCAGSEAERSLLSQTCRTTQPCNRCVRFAGDASNCGRQD